MKILIVSQHYWPENFRINDIAETLAASGYDVTVLCGLPNYPKGYVLEDYKKGKNRRQEHNGVHIIRAKEIGRRNNIVFRLLNYWSFQHFGKRLVAKIANDFDVVLINELSPIMSAYPGLKYAKKNNKKIIMYEMDLWPESLLAGGIKKDSLIYKYFRKISANIYSQCNKIFVSTKEHIEYIKRLPKCHDLDIEYLPQYAETIFEQSNCAAENNQIIDLMFAGNIGKAQSIDKIIRTAAILKENNKFKFHIVGDGSELNNAKQLAKDLNASNVIFYGQKKLSEMPKFYKMADALIVSLEDKPYANMTIPGKVQSYMAAGKPIIGMINGACSDFIKNNEIGFACESENCDSFANLIRGLDFQSLKQVGEHARKVYLTSFAKNKFFASLLSSFKEQ